MLRDIKTGIGLRKEISSRVLETIHYNDAIRVLQGLEDVNEIQDYKTQNQTYEIPSSLRGPLKVLCQPLLNTPTFQKLFSTTPRTLFSHLHTSLFFLSILMPPLLLHHIITEDYCPSLIFKNSIRLNLSIPLVHNRITRQTM